MSIDALEDYHTCTNCGTTVHDYGPDADAVNIEGRWFHRLCWEPEDDEPDYNAPRTTEML